MELGLLPSYHTLGLIIIASRIKLEALMGQSVGILYVFHHAHWNLFLNYIFTANLFDWSGWEKSKSTSSSSSSSAAGILQV